MTATALRELVAGMVKRSDALAELSEALGQDIAPSTASRWSTRGVLTLDGRRVFLRTTRIGRACYIKREDLAAFIGALSTSQV